MTDRFRNRFDDPSGDPMAVMGNLVDVILVFACGLIAALILRAPETVEPRPPQQLPPEAPEVRRGKELPSLPHRGSSGGAGFESVGTVYRDPQTGKLILVGE
ncbi:MAG: DUF2149 domain-containing protein [Myxococcota bacterium]